MHTNELVVWLARRRMKQWELAREMGWDPAVVSRIKNGVVEPKAHERAALAAFFGCSEADIFPANADETPGVAPV